MNRIEPSASVWRSTGDGRLLSEKGDQLFVAFGLVHDLSPLFSQTGAPRHFGRLSRLNTPAHAAARKRSDP
jgi:hypothetical protein